MTKWNNEAHAIGLKVLEEREKEERAKQEEKARLKRPSMHSLTFEPVPAAKAVVAENVAKLYLLVQKRNITPVFEFIEVGVQSFGATLRINDRVFKAEGPFSSKKEAKETVAKLGVEFLNENPELSSLSETGGVLSAGGGQGVVTELNLRCQKLKMAVPEYNFAEMAKGQFSATLVLGGVSFEEKGPFLSKKLAKEAVAKHGLAHLENASSPAASGMPSVELAAKLHSFVDRHRLDPPKFEFTELGVTPKKYSGQLHLDGEKIQNAGPFPTKHEAQNAITIQALVHLEQKYKDNEENWIELLNLYAQSSTATLPIYEDFHETSTRQKLWSSQVTIPLHTQPFGHRDRPFHSKKQARQNAAREAILWLRENHHLPEDGPPPKKKQKKHANSVSTASSSGSNNDKAGDGIEISYARQVNGKLVDPLMLLSLLSSSSSSSNIYTTSLPSFHLKTQLQLIPFLPQIPNPQFPTTNLPPDLCMKNSIPVPTYTLTATTPTAPYYKGHAHFPTGIIAHGRPIGSVENIFGKKNAKEAVARNVLRYLVECVREREADDRRLLGEAGFGEVGGVGMGMGN